MKREKIVFFFPWREVSGGPVYLTNLANSLSKLSRYDVWYVDYKDGLSEKMLDHNHVTLIAYSEPFLMEFFEPITLITPIYCAAHIPKLHGDSKILFINWHNYCIQALLDSWRLSEKSLQSFLKMVGKNNAECFVDRSHWLAQNKWCGPNCLPTLEQYVPLVIEPRKYKARTSIVCPGEMHIAVLGRLCKDKIYGVLNLLDQINNLKPKINKHLYIIGEGPETPLLLKAGKAESVHVHMMGTMTGEQLQIFIANNVDVLFGMGLSVLEGAAIGVPSVVMPHNVEKFNQDAYVFIHESSGYATGWYNTQVEEMGVIIHTLSEIIEDVYKPGNKANLGKAGLQYLKENHLENRSEMEKALYATKLRAREFEEFRKKEGKIYLLGVPIAKLYTSFDESEKTVSLFGINNFFKSKNTAEGKQFLLFNRRQNLLSAKKEGKYFRLYILNIRVPFLKM